MADQPILYSDMTEAQMLEWGKAEGTARKADLEANRTAEGLKTAQDNAEARRKQIGASRGQAADMVVLASRQARRSV